MVNWYHVVQDFLKSILIIVETREKMIIMNSTTQMKSEYIWSTYHFLRESLVETCSLHTANRTVTYE